MQLRFLFRKIWKSKSTAGFIETAFQNLWKALFKNVSSQFYIIENKTQTISRPFFIKVQSTGTLKRMWQLFILKKCYILKDSLKINPPDLEEQLQTE